MRQKQQSACTHVQHAFSTSIYFFLALFALIILMGTSCRQNNQGAEVIQSIKPNTARSIVGTNHGLTQDPVNQDKRKHEVTRKQKEQNEVAITNTGSKKNVRGKKQDEEDGMQEAMEQEFLKTQDPTIHRVPTERMSAAKETVEAMKADISSRTNALAWTERGPNNIGGRTRAIIVDKNDVTGNTIFAGSVGGGIWKCTNFTTAGYTWTRVNDKMDNLAITALAQDPSNLQVMYAGTGEGFFNFDAIRGGGIFKSTDGGATWAALASTVPGTSSDFSYVQDVVVTATGVVYATASGAFCNSGGVLKSTNGGTSWTRVIGTWGGIDCTTAVDFVGVDLEIAANGDLYATTGLFGNSTATYSKIFKSLFTNPNQGDNGQWTNITPTPPAGDAGFRRIELACAPSNNQFLYALCQAFNGNSIRRLYQSTNAGGAWTEVVPPTWCDAGTNTTDFTRGQAWYDLIAAIDPTTTNNIYIGGVDVMKSTNAGLAFSQLTQWASGCAALPNVHADIHNIIFINGSSTNLIVAHDGGISYSTNGGSTFTNKNNGYNITQYYAAAMEPVANAFLAGAQDNGTHKLVSAGIASATTFTGGDGGFCHISQKNPLVQMSAYTTNYVTISRNGGSSFLSTLGDGSGRFINASDYDDKAGILYMGDIANYYGRIINTPSGTAAYNYSQITALGGTIISAVEVDPNTANRVWLGGSGSGTPRIVRVDNAQAAGFTATQFNIPAALSGWYVSNIDVEIGNANHLLVTFSNYGVTSIFETIDGGTNWTAIEGNLPDIPIRWGLFLPSGSTEGVIAVATELGVFTTPLTNGVSTVWTANSTNLPNVRTDMLEFRRSDRTLLAATHGRGLFSTTISITPNTWAGTVSNAWTNAANWSAGRVPTATDDVVIPTAGLNMPVLVTAVQSCFNLTVQAGASINITTGSVQLPGNIVMNGTTTGTGALLLNGELQQSLSGIGTVANLQLNNTNGAAITAGGSNRISITDVLTITSGTLVTNNNLTLKSTPALTARVAPVLGSITGNVTVERAVSEPTAKRAWRLLTSPLRSASGSSVFVFDTWQLGGAIGASGIGNGTLITGPAANSATNGLDVISGAGLKSYNGTSLVDIINTKTAPLFTNAASAANVGYFLFSRGDRSSTSLTNVSKTMLSATGALQTGDQTFATSAILDAYTLLPNPYASPVDFDLFRQNNSGSNIKPNFYFWDPNLSGVGAYVTVSYDGTGTNYTIIPSGPDRTRFIQSGQAVFVQRSVSGIGTASVVFKETQKGTTTTNNVFRSGEQLEKLFVNLEVVNPGGSTQLADGLAAKFHNNYSNLIGDEDATKLYNIDENIFFKRAGYALSVEGRKLVDESDTLFIGMSNMLVRNYQFIFSPTGFDAPGLTAFMEDAFTGYVTPISLLAPTIVAFSVTTDAASSGTNRFRVVFRGSVSLPVTITSVKAYQKGTGVQVEWQVKSESGIRNYEVEKSADGTRFIKQSTLTANNTGNAAYDWFDMLPVTGVNYYRIKANAADGGIKYTQVVKVNIGSGKPGISIFPNPVKDRFTLSFTSMARGTYTVSLSNSAGVKVFSKMIAHTGGNVSEMIALEERLPRGIYQLEVNNTDTRFVQKVVLD